MNYLFACYELGNLDDDVHGFLHVLDRHELIAAVEVQATGKDIGTRQALERELGTVRTSANGFTRGSTPTAFMAAKAVSMICITGSICSRIL